MDEVWKAIIDYEGLYEVSSLGRVRNVLAAPHRIVGQVLATHLTHDGYPRLCLYKAGAGKMFTVHRLVAMAFLGPVPPSRQVNHKDGNKQFNAFTNLEYVSVQENVLHAVRTGLKPIREQHPKAKLTWDKVRTIRTELIAGTSGVALARRFGVTPTAIHLIKKGINWAPHNSE